MDPAAVRALAGRLQRIAATAAQLKADLAADPGAWRGTAADRFEARLDELPSELGHVGDSFHLASNALTTWAADLEQFQHEARSGMAAVSAASSHLASLTQHSPPPNAKPDPTAAARQHEAEAEVRQAQATMTRIGQDLDARARVCQMQIDSAAPRVAGGVFGTMLNDALSVTHAIGKNPVFRALDRNLALRRFRGVEDFVGNVGGFTKDLEYGSLFLGKLRHEPGAGLKLWREIDKGLAKNALKYRSGFAHAIDRVRGEANLLVKDGSEWKGKLGRSMETISKDATKLIKLPGVEKGLRLFGHVAGAAGLVLGAWQAVDAFNAGDILDGALDVVTVVASGVLLVAASPVVVGVALGAIAAVTIYQNRQELGRAAVFAADHSPVAAAWRRFAL